MSTLWATSGGALLKNGGGALIKCDHCPCTPFDPCPACSALATINVQTNATLHVYTRNEETFELEEICTYTHTTNTTLARRLDVAWHPTPNCVYTPAVAGYDFAGTDNVAFHNGDDPSDAATWSPVISPIPNTYLDFQVKLECHDPPELGLTHYCSVRLLGSVFAGIYFAGDNTRSAGFFMRPDTSFGYTPGSPTYTPLYHSVIWSTNGQGSIDMTSLLFNPATGDWDLDPYCPDVDHSLIWSVTLDLEVVIYE